MSCRPYAATRAVRLVAVCAQAVAERSRARRHSTSARVYARYRQATNVELHTRHARLETLLAHILSGRPAGFVTHIKATCGEGYERIVDALSVLAFGDAAARRDFFGEAVKVGNR